MSSICQCPKTAGKTTLFNSFPIPFIVGGIDLIGHFAKAPGNLQFCIVAIDYMTKYVETKALQLITERDCKKFFNDFVFMRFGIPRVLVSNNGLQFIGKELEAYLEELNITHRKSSIRHPQPNVQVEVTNCILLQSLEKRLC